MIALLAGVALADEVAFTAKPIAGHAVLDMRVGVASTEPGAHPYLCAEGSPLPWLSLEGCGTGAGFLHHGDQAEIAHFRARAPLVKRTFGRLDAMVMGGLGFAEVQAGADQAGFRFGAAKDERQIEGAGPEASLSVKARMWFDTRSYFTVDANTGIANVAAAPVVLGQEGPWVPFAAVTAGLGF